MASPVKTSIVSVCFALLIMVAAAHEGHEHTPGMDMSPSPTPHHSDPGMGNLVSPTALLGFLALIVTILVTGGRA
ncbi:hypothetical protein COLO4_37895 [Corchorus olitorius]|uniref:Uncharacterized protein n=1 Tax=Corchorus olitorius TaxID=93759 RepID=A0A1R3FY72_9ROSI|nr:hypothetical protein COLO4_37895 [Corchorus olitorius]